VVVEAEDVELDGLTQDDLALDVDGDAAEDDPEALDSDDGQHADSILDLNTEELTCEFPQIATIYHVYNDIYSSTYAYRTPLFPFTK